MTTDTCTSVEAILGYAFKRDDLITQALTHSSVQGVPNNDGLATLGDRIHNVYVARRVFASMPDAPKGLLTAVINPLCDGTPQARVVFTHALDEHLRLGGSRMGEGGLVNDRMASTLWEALVAAVEIDGGPGAAAAVLDLLFGPVVEVHLASWR